MTSSTVRTRLLESAFAAARESWPGVELSKTRFIEFLLQRLPAETSPDALATADLYLACACADGDPRAIAVFDRELVPVIQRALVTSGATEAERADLVQIVRKRVLVAAAGEEPRIGTFSGKGSLKAWVRVVATREAARLLAKERQQPRSDDDALASAIAPDTSPALALMKTKYREEFKRAFHAAVAALSDRERLLLRQSELDGLSIDELAKLNGVHRATTARWIQSAREAVLHHTRQALAERLAITSAEVTSIMRLIRSNLDVSLPALLRDAGIPGKHKRTR